MIGFYVTFYLLSIGYCQSSRTIDEISENFIVDLTTLLYARSRISAFLCLEEDNAVKFSRQMSHYNLLHEVKSIFSMTNINEFSSRVSSQNFFVLDLDCPDAQDVLIKADASQLFIAPSKWLILQDLRGQMNRTTDEMKLREIFQELEIFPDSEVIVGQRIDDEYFKILSPYRPSPFRDLIIEDRGHWNMIDRLRLNDYVQTSRRRQNLRGTPLKSCLVMTDPDTLNHLTDYKHKLVDAVTKANYIWLQHLIQRMNATVNFTLRTTWGYRDKNGSWSGMIGLLDREEIDIGGTGTFLVDARIGIVDYVQLYTPVRSKFMFRQPPLSYTSNIFVLPFDRTVWISIGVLLLLTTVILYISMKWEWNRIESQQLKCDLPGELQRNPTVSDDLIVVFGAVSQQGFTYEPYTVSSRIVIFVLLMAALNLYTSYTGFIVALLQSPSSSIKTLQDLMNSGLKFGVHDIVYNRYYFGSFNDPVRKEFYERFVENKSEVWMSMEEGVRRLRTELFAFQGDSSCGYEVIQQTFEENEKCGIFEIDYLNVLDPMLVIKRKSPYREIIRVGAQWIKETGLQKRDTPKLFTEKPICTSRSNFVSVGTIECYAPFLIMSYGFIISFGMLLIEIIWSKRRRSLGKHENEIINKLENVTLEDKSESLEMESIE